MKDSRSLQTHKIELEVMKNQTDCKRLGSHHKQRRRRSNSQKDFTPAKRNLRRYTISSRKKSRQSTFLSVRLLSSPGPPTRSWLLVTQPPKTNSFYSLRSAPP